MDISPIFQRASGERDQELSEWRAQYVALSHDQKIALRELLVEAVSLASRFSRVQGLGIRMYSYKVHRDYDGAVDFEGYATLSPDVALQAIAHWDRGEDFVP